MSHARQRRFAAGVTLIVVGLGLFALQRFDNLESAAIFLVIGGAFLAAYLFRRAYGFLVPAGVLLGLGAGIALEDAVRGRVEPVPLGLGIGFLAIYLIARLYEGRSHWWPLVPGGILVLTALPRADRLISYLTDNWPLILVIIGVLVLLGGMRSGRGGAPSGD